MLIRGYVSRNVPASSFAATRARRAFRTFGAEKYTPEGPSALCTTTEPIPDRGKEVELMVVHSRSGYICGLRERFQFKKRVMY